MCVHDFFVSAMIVSWLEREYSSFFFCIAKIHTRNPSFILKERDGIFLSIGGNEILAHVGFYY